MLIEHGAARQAGADLDRRRRIVETDPSGKVVEGKCYFDLGQVDEAEGSFEAVLEMDAQNLVALKYLGMIQAGRGDLDAARQHFKRILKIDPGNREITRACR